jgi:hypothetical protein
MTEVVVVVVAAAAAAVVVVKVVVTIIIIITTTKYSRANSTARGPITKTIYYSGTSNYGHSN